jgi:hypothetical protein
MYENISPEEHQAQIAALSHEIYELRKQLEDAETQKRQAELLDPKNPFDNPTEYPDYNGDYRDIVPQIEVPGCHIPVEPNKSEKKRLRRFYNIGGACLLLHLMFSTAVAALLIGIIMFILQRLNPTVSYNDLYSYAYSSAIIISITTAVYLIANVLFSYIGLRWSGVGGKSLISTRDFGVKKAIQYCFCAIFIQYGAALVSTAFSSIFEKYGFSTDVDTSDMATSFIGTIVLILYECIIAPITEELFYRGTVLKVFSRANQRFAIVASAIFFGLAHGNLPQFLLAFLLGMFLAHIDVKHNSIIPSIIVHIFINTSATIINYSNTLGSEFVTTIVTIVYCAVAAVGLILFVKFSRKNKLPRTTPQQSRRGFAIAKTSFTVILAFAALMGEMAITIISSRLS